MNIKILLHEPSKRIDWLKKNQNKKAPTEEMSDGYEFKVE